MIVSPWIHTNDPIQVLKVNEKLDLLKNNLKNENYLKDMIKKYFIENKHRITLIMDPDENYIEIQQKKTEIKLENIVKNLKPKEITEINKKNEKLLASQNKIQKNDILPSLDINDIPKIIPNIINMKKNDKNIFYNEQQTNELVYISSLIKLPSMVIDKELLPYIPLFAHSLTKIGTFKYDYSELAEQIELNTGGIDSEIAIIPNLQNSNEFEISIILNSYCLEKNISKMIELIKEIHMNTNMGSDDKHLKILMEQFLYEISSEMVSNGTHFSTLYNQSTLTKTNVSI
jgi:presequence protease